MQSNKFVKWRLAVIAIACVVAYYLPRGDEDGDLAKDNSSISVKCAADGQAKNTKNVSRASAPNREDDCSQV
ncbi:hypothetical protein [Variovorax sp. HJSM1_2]|uniref:hypothetical protein n=1 Tax=Variovorax sp. HJSM1_2 TaxID=3366263 RepID=UPI003BF570D4